MLEWDVLPSTCEVLSGTPEKPGGGPLAINIYRYMIPIIPYKGMCVHTYACINYERESGGEIESMQFGKFFKCSK